MNHVRFHGHMRPGRAHRRIDNPYKRRPRRQWPMWGQVLDALCWAAGVCLLFLLAAWLVGRAVHGLNSLWLP